MDTNHHDSHLIKPKKRHFHDKIVKRCPQCKGTGWWTPGTTPNGLDQRVLCVTCKDVEMLEETVETDVVQIGKLIPGTNRVAKPYDEFMAGMPEITNAHNKIQEDAYANPDVLSEDETINPRPLTAEGELQMEAVHQVMPTLTPQQWRVLELSQTGVWDDEKGECDYSQAAIAKELGIGRTTVQDILERVGAKIRRQYDRLKKNGGQ